MEQLLRYRFWPQKRKEIFFTGGYSAMGDQTMHGVVMEFDKEWAS